MFLQVGAMRRNTWVLVLLAVVAAVAGSRLTAGVAAAQEFPPQPVIYSGAVTVSSGEDPDGFFVTARVLDYEASPVEVVSGAYSALIVSLPDNTYANLTLTFHLDGQQALETDTSLAPGLPLPKSNFNLTFAKLPDPTPTPTPVVVTPAVYSGAIVVAGSQPPAQAQLTARIGSYETTSISTNGPVFTNLVIAPPDDSAIGQPIQFFLNGFPSAPPAPPAIFQPGEFKTVNLIFVSFPEPTPTPPPPTPTPPPPPPPTPTPTPRPTATPIPPTATPIPPTPTPIPPTATRVPPTPTATRVPSPVAAVAVATPTAAPPLSPTPTPEPSGGGCSAPSANVSALTGLGNMLLLAAPIALIAGFRRRRR